MDTAVTAAWNSIVSLGEGVFMRARAYIQPNDCEHFFLVPYPTFINTAPPTCTVDQLGLSKQNLPTFNSNGWPAGADLLRSTTRSIGCTSERMQARRTQTQMRRSYL